MVLNVLKKMKMIINLLQICERKVCQFCELLICRSSSVIFKLQGLVTVYDDFSQSYCNFTDYEMYVLNLANVRVIHDAIETES